MEYYSIPDYSGANEFLTKDGIPDLDKAAWIVQILTIISITIIIYKDS